MADDISLNSGENHAGFLIVVFRQASLSLSNLRLKCPKIFFDTLEYLEIVGSLILKYAVPLLKSLKGWRIKTTASNQSLEVK